MSEELFWKLSSIVFAVGLMSVIGFTIVKGII